jgi:hypothetical protein
VMRNHTHMVIGVPGDPDPHHLREIYKSWATRALKKKWAVPKSGTFFTAGGSVRKKEDEAALQTAVIYVARKQPDPLVMFVGERWLDVVSVFDKASGAA